MCSQAQKSFGEVCLWLGSFERCATANGWGETQKLHKLPAHLTGVAEEHFALLTAAEKETYTSLISSLRRILIPSVYREYHYEQVRSRCYAPDEDPRLYVLALRNLFTTPTLQDILDFVLQARALQQLSCRVSKEMPVKSKEIALSRTIGDLCIAVANFSKDQELHHQSLKSMSANSSPSKSEQRCANCNSRVHVTSSSPWPMMCLHCMTWGHPENNCPHALCKRGDFSTNSPRNNRGGHVSQRSAPADVNKDECTQIFAFKNVNKYGAHLSSSNQQPLISCKVNSVLVRALIDTGSMKSLISSRIYGEIRPRPPIDVFAKSNCISITRQPLAVMGVVQANLQLSCGDECAYEGTFLVCSKLLPPLECILGWDFLTRNGLSIIVNGSNYLLSGAQGNVPLTPCESIWEESLTYLSAVGA